MTEHTLLSARRIRLLASAARLRNLRRMKAASLVEAELRSVTARLLAMEAGR